MHAAFQLLHWVSGFRTPPAAFVPTSTGDVQLEWHQHEMDIEVYFLGNTTVRTWVWDHRSNEESEVDISRDVAPLVAALQTLTNRADK